MKPPNPTISTQKTYFHILDISTKLGLPNKYFKLFWSKKYLHPPTAVAHYTMPILNTDTPWSSLMIRSGFRAKSGCDLFANPDGTLKLDYKITKPKFHQILGGLVAPAGETPR